MIQPYYSDEWVTIYNCNSKDFMVQSDVIITDPPYGIGEDYSRNISRGKCAPSGAKVLGRAYGEFNWDVKVDREHIQKILDNSKNQVIWGGNYYADWLPASSCWLVWDKDNSGDFADCELAWTSFKTAVRKFKWRWNGMLQEDMKHKEERVHPTQKPLALMKWVVANYTKPNDIIEDTFMGSGTTLLAAKTLGRKSIGIELRKDYCDIAIKRLQQTVMNFEVQPKEKIEQGCLI